MAKCPPPAGGIRHVNDFITGPNELESVPNAGDNTAMNLQGILFAGATIPVVAATCFAEVLGDATSKNASPDPHSTVIRQLQENDATVKTGSNTGDNWPITRIGFGRQITAEGDGPGFDKQPSHLALGFARIEGNPPNV